MSQQNRRGGVVVSLAAQTTPTNTGNSARYVIPVIDMRGMTPDERNAVFASRCNREVGESIREFVAAATSNNSTANPPAQRVKLPILESA